MKIVSPDEELLELDYEFDDKILSIHVFQDVLDKLIASKPYLFNTKEVDDIWRDIVAKHIGPDLVWLIESSLREKWRRHCWDASMQIALQLHSLKKQGDFKIVRIRGNDVVLSTVQKPNEL